MSHRIVGWLRPREGWAVFCLLVLTGLFLAVTVVAAEWVRGDEALVVTAMLALLAGRWTARRRWNGRSQVMFALDVGIPIVLATAARGPHRVVDLLIRWRAWFQVLVWGGEAQDPAIFLLVVASLAWCAVFFGGWWLARDRNALTGFFPSFILTGLSTFYSEQGAFFLFSGVFCVFLLSALGSLRSRQEQWESEEVSYAVDLEFDTVLVAAAVAVVLILLAVLLPAFSLQGFTRWLNETFSRPAEQVESEMGRLFGGVRPPRREEEDGQGAGGDTYLPRLRLLGGRPELEEIEVFHVWSDPDVIPYWRGATYDRYTGRGWQMTGMQEGVTGTLPLSHTAASPVVVQRFVRAAAGRGLLYSLAEPVALEPEATAFWRSDGDLIALMGGAQAYTVTSRVVQPTEADLRAARPVYPPGIAELYLQLPDTVPQRVLALAGEVVAGADTPYERAVRLEQYLRRFPYTLDVTMPPADRDVADYFLFELEAGYCDYYATAFVVMARSVGVPARLVSGYLGGEPDPASGATVVVEANGHSWAEVYFAGWGWVRFEPTGSRPDTVPALGEEQAPAAQELEEQRPAGGFVRPFLWVGAVVAFGVVVGASVWWWRRRRAARRRPEPAVLSSVWHRLVGEGARLGVPYQRGQTVVEYTRVVEEALTSRAADARWRREETEARAAQVRQALESFALAFNCYLYGDGPAQLEASWSGLWQGMARLRRTPFVGW
jgi:hypothetical protein